MDESGKLLENPTSSRLQHSICPVACQLLFSIAMKILNSSRAIVFVYLAAGSSRVQLLSTPSGGGGYPREITSLERRENIRYYWIVRSFKMTVVCHDTSPTRYLKWRSGFAEQKMFDMFLTGTWHLARCVQSAILTYLSHNNIFEMSRQQFTSLQLSRLHPHCLSRTLGHGMDTNMAFCSVIR